MDVAASRNSSLLSSDAKSMRLNRLYTQLPIAFSTHVMSSINENKHWRPQGKALPPFRHLILSLYEGNEFFKVSWKICRNFGKKLIQDLIEALEERPSGYGRRA